MPDIDRLRKLAGMPEIQGPDDWEDTDDDARTDRESKIKRLIATAFQRLRLPIAEYEWGGPYILYDESDRESTVWLDDSSIDLDLLVQLKKSGLSDKYEIGMDIKNGLTVTFVVSPSLDQAV